MASRERKEAQLIYDAPWEKTWRKKNYAPGLKMMVGSIFAQENKFLPITLPPYRRAWSIPDRLQVRSLRSLYKDSEEYFNLETGILPLILGAIDGKQYIQCMGCTQ